MTVRLRNLEDETASNVAHRTKRNETGVVKVLISKKRKTKGNVASRRRGLHIERKGGGGGGGGGRDRASKRLKV